MVPIICSFHHSFCLVFLLLSKETNTFAYEITTNFSFHPKTNNQFMKQNKHTPNTTNMDSLYSESSSLFTKFNRNRMVYYLKNLSLNGKHHP